MTTDPVTPGQEPGGPEPSGGISLRRRVYILMSVGILFPLVVMGVASFTWLRALDERLLAGRLAAATTVAAHFDSELTDDLEVLQRFAASVAPGLDDGDADAVRRALRDAHDRLRHRESLFLLGARGETVAEEPPGPSPSAPRAAKLVEEVLANGRPRLSGLVAGTRGPVVHELVPIRNWKGQVVGVAGGTFRPERRDFEKMLRNLRPGGTGFVDLVDGTGHVLASTDRDRVGRVTECAHQMTQLAAEKRSMTTLCAECHAKYGVEVRPGEHLTFASLGSAPWGVVVRQDAGDAMVTGGALPWYTVLGLLALEVLLAGAFAWGAAQSVTAPVAVLTEHAERIAGGHLDRPIPLLGSDEVGRLGQSLEKMRQNLGQLIEHVAQVNAQLEERVARRTKQLNEANEALKEREEVRGQLLRKVITAQEDERRRISRELHDETSQDLAVLAMGLEAAQDALRGGKTPRLDEVKAVAVRALEDVHRLILDLRPSVLDDLGLVSAIRWYAERQLSSRGISVRCEFGDMPRLPPETETALFRISQETLGNVARHAQASAALIAVGIEGGEVRIAIEDDGRGFEPGAVVPSGGRQHWGVMGIRERAEILGGKAVIESSPGKGTRVVVRIPVPRAAQQTSPSPPETAQQPSPTPPGTVQQPSPSPPGSAQQRSPSPPGTGGESGGEAAPAPARNPLPEPETR